MRVKNHQTPPTMRPDRELKSEGWHHWGGQRSSSNDRGGVFSSWRFWRMLKPLWWHRLCHPAAMHHHFISVGQLSHMCKKKKRYSILPWPTHLSASYTEANVIFFPDWTHLSLTSKCDDKTTKSNSSVIRCQHLDPMQNLGNNSWNKLPNLPVTK